VHRSDRVGPNDDTGLTVAASQLNLLRAVNGSLQSGRFLNTVTERFPTAVLGSAAASVPGFPKLTPGFTPQIVINNRWFTVIGWDAARTQLAFSPAPTEIYLQAQQASIEAVRGVLPATIEPQLPALVQVSLPSAALAAKIDAQDTFSARRTLSHRATAIWIMIRILRNADGFRASSAAVIDR
jgi:putative ABC transport system permease protein